MKQREYRELPEADQLNFYRCPACGEMVDRRQVDEVIVHHSHVLRPYRWSVAGREMSPRRFARSRPGPRRNATAPGGELRFRSQE